MTKKDQGLATAYNAGDLLDDKEAASFLRLSPKTLANWRCAGKGPHSIRLGERAIRYRFSDLEAFIVASTAQAA